MITRPNVKVNLGLHILRKREDGYHDIETLFLPCHEFHDTLEIITGDDYSRTSASLFARYGTETLKGFDDKPSVYSEEHPVTRPIVQGISESGKLMITIARAEGVDWNPVKDLCVRAYTLLDADYELPPVKIFLEKSSPVGAGLGSGSADAAFTLKMLNDIFSLGLSDDTLACYASRLGSDCAFFVYNRPMFGNGRGDILSPFPIDLSPYDIKVIIPEGIFVSTAEAYRSVTPRETSLVFPEVSSPHKSGESTSPTKVGATLKEILSRPVETWRDVLVNDFEPSVFAAHPELAAIKQSLYDSGALYASLSGSGSALFALYKK